MPPPIHPERPSFARAVGLTGVTIVVLVAACAGPSQRVRDDPASGPRLAVGGVDSAPDTLVRAVQSDVGLPSLGPALLAGVYRWRPTVGEPLVAWIVCRGAGDTRACSLAVGRVRNGSVQVLGVQPVGWSVPRLGVAADPSELIVAGEDGRGPWRQLVRFESVGEATVRFGRRSYPDGS